MNILITHTADIITVLAISAGWMTIWFKSPAFVSLMQIISATMYGKNRDKIYTQLDAELFAADHLGKLATLLQCIICMSFWTTLFLSIVYAKMQNLPVIYFVLTCTSLAPMFNYLILDAGNDSE